MSVHVSSWLWRNSTAKGSELLLLLAIADWADDNGKAWPSVDTLSQKTRLSRRQTQALIRQSVEESRLKLHPNQGPKSTNIYQIIMGGEKIAPVQSGAEGGAVQRTEGVQPTAPNTSGDTSENTSIDSSGDEEKAPAVDDLFETFWQAYPKPQSTAGRSIKKQAKAKFKIALKKASVDDIMAGLEWWKKTDKWKSDGGKYIDGAQKWLNQEMWEAAEEQPAPQEGGSYQQLDQFGIPAHLYGTERITYAQDKWREENPEDAQRWIEANPEEAKNRGWT